MILVVQATYSLYSRVSPSSMQTIPLLFFVWYFMAVAKPTFGALPPPTGLECVALKNDNNNYNNNNNNKQNKKQNKL